MSSTDLTRLQRVIKDPETGEFYQGSDQWTADSRFAKTFDNMWDLTTEVNARGLKNVSVEVLLFGARQFEVCL
jgi:hypothetical protein